MPRSARDQGYKSFNSLYEAENRLPEHDRRVSGDGVFDGQRMVNSGLRHGEDFFFYTECR
jgi:hypothetical protein